MSAKMVFPCALMLAVLGVSVLRAEGDAPPDKPPVAGAAPAHDTAAHGVMPSRLSRWITYGRPDCCDPIGGHGPIGSELFVRTGPTLPVAGGALNNTLETGWMVQAGGRSLFFNPTMEAAWTVELSMGHMIANGNRADLIFPLPPVVTLGPTGAPTGSDPRSGSVRTLHRTFGGIALGREWYLMPANDLSHYWGLWRFGWDGGARIGTSRLDFTENRVGVNFQRVNDVFYSAFFALHSDVEVPCGCCIFHAGLRGEWQYNWIDVFPFTRQGDLHDVNLLLTLGVRF